MAGSQFAAVVDALLALWQPLDTAGTVDLFDGVEGRADDALAILVVGHTGEDDSIDFEQEVGPLGTTRPKDEITTVPCLLRVWTGDEAPATCRASAKTLYDTVQNLVRDTPGLAMASSLSVRTQITGGSYKQPLTDRGRAGEIRFTVRVTCRI